MNGNRHPKAGTTGAVAKKLGRGFIGIEAARCITLL